MAAAASQSLDNLTRRHGIKVIPAERCSVEECTIAVAEVVGYASILSAARMNSAIVIFLDNVEKVNGIVENGIVINNVFTPVMPLVQPAKRITISNVPPFIRDEIIERELMRHGKIVSKIRKISLGCRSPQLKHVVSFRRQTHMVLKSENEELNLAMKFRVDNYDYVIYATSENMKCFGCKQEGHVIRTCPERQELVLLQNGNEEQASENRDEEQTNENRNEERENESGNEMQKQLETGEGSSVDTGKQDGNGEFSGGKLENVSEVEKTSIDISLIGMEGGEDTDMVEDESVFKTPAIKRKLRKKGHWKRARKVTGDELARKGDESPVVQMESDISNADESAPESGSESSGSVNSVLQKRSVRSDYTFEKIRKFLQTTKGMRGVEVEEYFPDRELFISSARMLMKEKDVNSFTDQEIFRLKKIVQKLKLNILNDEFETE